MPQQLNQMKIAILVDDLFEQPELAEPKNALEAAGATVTDRPHDRPWGIYSGYFRDLDGHLWEILWNPELAGI